MTTFRIYRGLPGSGKTTEALAWVADNPQHRVRLNRDTARIMLHGGRLGTRWQEDAVTALLHPAMWTFLRSGTSVVCDDTNLDQAATENMAFHAVDAGARIEVVDLSVIPLEVCFQRDARRPRPERVGKAVIRHLHRQHIVPLNGRGFPPLVPQPF